MRTKQILLPLLTAVLALASCSKGTSYREFEDMVNAQKVIPVRESPESDVIIYINDKGENAFDKEFGYASAFVDGMAIVSDAADSELFGYIDESGEYAIKPKYASATCFVDGVAIVAEPDSCLKVIDKKGNTLYSLKGYSQAEHVFNGRILAQKRNNKFSIIDAKSGKEDIGKSWATCDELRVGGNIICGRAAFNPNDDKNEYVGKWSLVGNPMNVAKFGYHDELAPMRYRELLIVKSGDKYGVKDLDGTWVVNPKYTAIVEDVDYIYVLNEDSKWGVIDQKGETVIKNKYKSMMPALGHKVFGATIDGDSWNIIGLDGKRVKKSKQYDDVRISKHSKYILVEDKESKWGTIGENAVEVISPEFDDMYYAMGDNFMVRVDDKWGLCDSKGQIISDPEYGNYEYTAPTLAQDQSYNPAEIVKLLDTEVKNFSKKIQDGVSMEKLNAIYNMNIDFSKEYSKSERIGSYRIKNDEVVANGVTLSEFIFPYNEVKHYGSYYWGYDKYFIPKDNMPTHYAIALSYALNKSEKHDQMLQRIVEKYKMEKINEDGTTKYYTDSDGVLLTMTSFVSNDELTLWIEVAEGELCGITDEDYEEMEAEMKADSVAGGGVTDDYSWLSTRLATNSDIAGKSKQEIRILRNAIFARHGYIFKDKTLKQHFSQFAWYKPQYTDVSGQFNSIERKNVSFLKSHE